MKPRYQKLTLTILLLLVLLFIAIFQVQAAVNYQVKSGDTLWDISQKFRVPVKIISRINNIEDVTNLYVGQKLVIKNNHNQITITIENSDENNHQQYTVKSGDSLWKISQKFGVSIEQLMEINNLENYSLYYGQTLIIPVKGTNNSNETSDNSTNYIYYTVKPGDILWNIAQKYNTTVQKLVNINDIKNSYDLYIGRELIIPIIHNSETNPTDEAGDNTENTETDTSYVPYYFYEVVEGDKIWTIADYFGLRVSELINFNSIADINAIQKGDILIIPLEKSNKFSYLKTMGSRLNHYYRVKNQETLTQIAEYYEIPKAGLRAINHLTQDEEVYPGQKLLMPVSPGLFKKHEIYKIMPGGEYLYDIAFEKGVSIKSILKANYLKNPNLKFKSGTTIIITLDEDSKTTWIEYENGKPKNSWLSY